MKQNGAEQVRVLKTGEDLGWILDTAKEIAPEAEEYTGINTEMCNEYGVDLKEAITNFSQMAEKADYIVAHNGRNFDVPILANVFRQLEIKTPGKTLIDTMTDLPLPNNCKSRNLTYLNGFHLFANPFPHRAVTDVLSMLTVLSKYPWDQVREIAESPIAKYVAKFSYPNERRLGSKDAFAAAMVEFNRIKNECKNLGFRWHPETKTWVLETKEILTKDMEFPCPVQKV